MSLTLTDVVCLLPLLFMALILVVSILYDVYEEICGDE